MYIVENNDQSTWREDVAMEFANVVARRIVHRNGKVHRRSWCLCETHFLGAFPDDLSEMACARLIRWIVIVVFLAFVVPWLGHFFAYRSTIVRKKRVRTSLTCHRPWLASKIFSDIYISIFRLTMHQGSSWCQMICWKQEFNLFQNERSSPLLTPLLS